MKIFYVIAIILLLFINACAPTTVPEEKEQEPSEVDVVSEISKKPIEDEEEVEEIEEEIKEQEEMVLEVQELLGIANKKVKSLRYMYKGPETKDFFYDFFVKGNNVKYLPDPDYKTIDVDDDAYDTIYLDKESKTAQAYCDDRQCRVKGKKADLDYDEVYILTSLDWLNNIESAEKIGEELIEQRNTWKLSTNQGTMWIDTYYGVPMQVEFEGKLYKFQKMSFNDVKDEDVTP